MSRSDAQRERRGRGRWGRAAGAFAGVVVLIVTAGCNILGPAFVLAEGPPTTSAALKIDSSKNYVIFIDDLRSRLPKRSLRGVMGESAEEALLSHKAIAAGKLISSASAHRVAESESNTGKLSIVEVGRRVGADVVIYVTIDGFYITRDGQTEMPAAVARVKVLDVAVNQRVWPAMEEGYNLILQPREQRGNLPLNLAGRAAIETELSRRLGVALAQLFYEHENRESIVGN